MPSETLPYQPAQPPRIPPMTDSPTATRIAVRDDHNCFGCGADNPWGLHLIFFAEPGGAVYSHWTPQVNHQGYDGMVHGGIISTVFDEVMAWSVTNAGIANRSKSGFPPLLAPRSAVSPAEPPKSRPPSVANRTASCSPRPPPCSFAFPKRSQMRGKRNTPESRTRNSNRADAAGAPYAGSTPF
jgi:hypothetical protein